MDKSKRRKNDLLLLGGVLLAGCLLLFCLLFFGRSGARVEVRVGGRLVQSLPLDSDRTVEIRGAEGGYNLLEIRDGKAWIREADCPDELCVGMGKISKVGQSVVCLPHQVVVEIVDSDELPDVDAVTGTGGVR